MVYKESVGQTVHERLRGPNEWTSPLGKSALMDWSIG